MNPVNFRTLIIAAAATLALSGCDTLQQASKPARAPSKPAASPPPPRPAPSTPAVASPSASAEQQALREGIELYNKGQFNDAIKRLGSPDITAGSKAGQVQAYKYIAFSYCVTSRQTLCRQTFEKAFKLDSSFDLLPGEHGHPLWGPAFTRARKQSK